ncbi:MAG: hypothetical protein L3J92_03460 [Thermoplasmata archaeon]|nr:hypothetical protein [Thermoplasmata archaeon]
MESIIVSENKTVGPKFADELVEVGNVDGGDAETRTTDVKSPAADGVVDAPQAMPAGLVEPPNESEPDADLPVPVRAAPVSDLAVV